VSGNLEHRYRWISVGLVLLFGATLALGLLLYTLDHQSAIALVVLQTGLFMLMASPAVRIAVIAAERIRRRDWGFLGLTAVVVIEVGIVLWRAGTRA